MVLTVILFPTVCSEANPASGESKKRREHGHQGAQASGPGSEAACPDS